MLIPRKPNKKQTSYDYVILVAMKNNARGHIEAYRSIMSLYDKPNNPNRTQISDEMIHHLQTNLAMAVWDEKVLDDIIVAMAQHYKLTGEKSRWEGKLQSFHSLSGVNMEASVPIAMQDTAFAARYQLQLDIIEKNKINNKEKWLKKMEKKQVKLQLT